MRSFLQRTGPMQSFTREDRKEENMEIQFKKPVLEDRELIKHYLSLQQSRSCELTFGNIYLWSCHYKVKFAVVEDMLIFQSADETSYSFPIGRREGVKAALETLISHAKERGAEFKLHMVTPGQFDILEELYPGRFEIEYDRDDADYVYEAEKLASLSGKKYHGKKNHINKFKRMYPDWSYEPLNDENVEDCFQMALLWRRENGCEADREKNAEMCVALNSLRLYKELGFCGGVLRVNGQVAAFTVGEPVSDDTMVVHIEKAMSDIQGAYTMINQQFVQHECMDYQYVNREDDVGEEGLRQAKLSYHPAFLVEKGTVTQKADI